MRFTIHVLIEGTWFLVDCGLDTIQATDLTLALEAYGYKCRVDPAGSADELLGSPTIPLHRVRSLAAA